MSDIGQSGPETLENIPQVDGESCVHGLSPSASCRACVQVCPVGAFVLDNEQLGLDASKCDACGLCVPVCPQQAISLPFTPLLRMDERERLVVLAACEKSGWKKEGCVVCTHALSARDIARYEKRSLREIIFFNGDCEECERSQTGEPEETAETGEEPKEEQSNSANAVHLVEQLNQWRRSRHQRQVSLRVVVEKDWRRALSDYNRPAERPNPSRRRLLVAFRGSLAEDLPVHVPSSNKGNAARERLYFHRPFIEELKCNGCDACINICPHGALELEKKDAAMAYKIDADSCTDCGLCIDVCSQDAIKIAPLGPLEQTQVPLLKAKCHKCGSPFHLPAAQGETGDICRICDQHDHTAKLFQVYD